MISNDHEIRGRSPKIHAAGTQAGGAPMTRPSRSSASGRNVANDDVYDLVMGVAGSDREVDDIATALRAIVGV